MNFEGRREKMVRTQIQDRGIKDPRVLEAFRKVPRHLFIPEGLAEQAYDDNPLPIGRSQTISQPYTVARMTEALGLTGKEKILEIGAGSGYQAAILAELGDWVYSVERISELARNARAVLDRLGYVNVAIRVGDGTRGWKEESPFDAIIITAGGPKIPEPLFKQLAEDGRMVIPVGDKISQNMKLVTKRQGEPIVKDLGAYRFVELVGEYGWKR